MNDLYLTQIGKNNILKITLVIILFLFFSKLALSSGCSPVAQIYINNETKTEGMVYTHNPLSRLTSTPFSTITTTKSEIAGYGFCARDISSISSTPEIIFNDFSTLDKLIITINFLFLLFLIIIPFVLFKVIYKKLKLIWERIIWNLVFILGYILWSLTLLMNFGY
jgi:hypothetical protein